MVLSSTIFLRIYNKIPFCFLLLYFCFNYSFSQDLEPRFLSSVPIKTNFAIVAYGYSDGGIIFNAQEVENLNAKMHSFVGVYGRSFKLFNKPAKFDVVVPYSTGLLNALVSNVDTSATRKGFLDPSIRISAILIGDKPLTVEEFANREKERFKLGVAFKVKPPLGHYNDEQLINLGSNRWSFQFKLASSYAITKKIILELHLESWVFAANNSYYNGNNLKQEPLLSSQLHAAYIFSPKFWVSASIGQIAFGETLLNGIGQENDQKNSRYGFTLSYKVANQSSLKAVVTNGLYTNFGNSFTTFLAAYSFIWFDKKK